MTSVTARGEPGAADGVRGTIRVLIADDHDLMVRGIRRALEDADGVEIVGEARRGTDVLPMVARTQPDVVLLDIRLPKLDGLICLDLIRKRHPDVKVVMLSVFNDPEHIEKALRRGAHGYVVKSVNPADLAPALRQVAEETVFHALRLPEADESSVAKEAVLTEREIAILKAVAGGLSNHAIGDQLWVTEQTVKFHLTNIYRKLRVANRTEAARYAYEHGLAESPVLEHV
jgi:DNA-binding NarL/FixJ family response regulator